MVGRFGFMYALFLIISIDYILIYVCSKIKADCNFINPSLIQFILNY